MADDAEALADANRQVSPVTTSPSIGRRLAAGVAERFRRRQVAASQMVRLTPYAGAPLVTVTVLVHLLAGAAPVVFMVATAVALPGVLAGAMPLALWVAVAAFLLQQVLAPVQLVLSREIARHVDTACISRLTGFALGEATLAGLERPDVADRLNQVDEAFEQWTLTPGAALEGGLALIARYTQLVGAVAVLGWAAGPWAMVAGALVAVVARTGQAEAFHQWGSLIRSFQPARRRVAYVRELATSTRAAKEIRALGLLEWLEDRHQAETRTWLDPMWFWRRRIYGAPFLAYAAVALVGSAVALLLVADGGASDAAARLVAVSLSVQAVVLCCRFGVMFPESDIKLVYGRSAFTALEELEHTLRQQAGPPRAATSTPGAVVAPSGQIAFHGVEFAYRAGVPVLDGLDLVLPAGTSTALIGVNGAGKTTLVKLLAGIYTPDGGRVRVDGTDLRSMDQDQWQRHFAVTFQDFLRYELTLRDNVAMGAIDHRADDAGIREVLDRVGLDDLLERLPGGLETPLTRSVEGGRELSGGQWQRLALARALFAVRHGASVLVLDEPTAQLDARGEAEFYDTFLELTRGVTSLVISHRFSTVRNADRIVVLDDGRITESGTHDELVGLGGVYARMFEVQAKRFAAADPIKEAQP
ncbi:ABC transporter ATP-binding protein [Xylanimonas sp. McL0601]|uniref:ABC transporter ATP-binding protein n=1 Tax=Xylanimonas sp. McL0601 TaxID=3414739 RepID=UPI003CF49E85